MFWACRDDPQDQRVIKRFQNLRTDMMKTVRSIPEQCVLVVALSVSVPLFYARANNTQVAYHIYAFYRAEALNFYRDI